MGSSSFRFSYLSPYADAFRLGGEAHIIDTAKLTPAQSALEIANTINIP
jgi:hypothetical protein